MGISFLSQTVYSDGVGCHSYAPIERIGGVVLPEVVVYPLGRDCL